MSIHLPYQEARDSQGTYTEHPATNCADAASNFEAQRIQKPEECGAKKPWNRNFDRDASRTECNAMVENNLQAMRWLDDVTSCSLDVTLGIGPTFIDCSRDCKERTRLER